MWSIIKEWITNEAVLTVGFKSFKAYTSEFFWTPELLQESKDIESLTAQAQLMQDSNNTSQETTHIYARLRLANERFRDKLHQRRTQVFQEIVTNLAQPQNSGAFMRMTKSIKKRKNKDHCQLDPREINEHMNYYKSTFGAEPMGQFEIVDETMEKINSNVDLGTIDVVDNNNLLNRNLNERERLILLDDVKCQATSLINQMDSNTKSKMSLIDRVDAVGLNVRSNLISNRNPFKTNALHDNSFQVTSFSKDPMISDEEVLYLDLPVINTSTNIHKLKSNYPFSNTSFKVES
ncbi:hypothetical protein O9G_005890 [Rozella allomycis CSF55]|uniref:Uncharacterized protein n=1 Tax=Rozella allomycis (strain CSF55) TaxID=988480 RepID=A0A075B2F4_ROZAC|nr:hypothetical protein O9G_005890 [Rozella allomycis CSF55]|eukprot:EPZ36775.1 hypothetical protein O9G_005890 [Rozella allomycis CSF55]